MGIAIGVLLVPVPAPRVTVESRAVIGAMQEKVNARTDAADDGAAVVEVVGVEVEVDTSVVALRVPLLFLGEMQTVIVLAAVLTG